LKWPLKKSLTPLGTRARVFNSVEKLTTALLAQARNGDHIIMLSNGDFGGLRPKLSAALRRRAKTVKSKGEGNRL
jgi:UDP-N-acetylmuramate: L-alanyl-gamma-D-glutamyl-meso-diaminopimelate ligase